MSSDPFATFIARLDAAGYDPRQTGPDHAEARCPGHGGSRRNLSVDRGDDGRALACCHHSPACTIHEIAAGLDMDVADLFPPGVGRPARRGGGSNGNGHRNGKDRSRASPNGGASGKAKSKPKGRSRPTPEAAIAGIARKLGRPTGEWAYHDDGGAEVARVYRFDFVDQKTGEPAKSYRPAHVTAAGWVLGDPPGLWPLYGLPELADADRVFVTEGEKTSGLARSLGLAATTSAHGGGAANKTDWLPLAGRDVVLLPDYDAPGEAYAADVLALLADLDPRPTVRLIRLPDIWQTATPPEEGDDLAERLFQKCGRP